MAIHSLALVLRKPSSHSEFIVAKQTPPPEFGDNEYDSYVDSDLWDLPSTQLRLLKGASQPRIIIDDAESCPVDGGLISYDTESALSQVLRQVGLNLGDAGEWRFLKHVQEPEFGPGPPIQTVFVEGKLSSGDQNFPERSKWMSVQTCVNWLLEVKPGSNRIGPLVGLGLSNQHLQPLKQKLKLSLRHQEYPPGVMLVPMKSRTIKPFNTTNLIIFAPEKITQDNPAFAAHGDAMIVDPGCHHEHHKELRKIVAALPRKLLVFVTHHHDDHIEGLSVVQKCNPDAILLAHEKTRHRIGKDGWSAGYISVRGGEDISVGGQRFIAIFAPGHTDGHAALLHESTNTLVAGDHCVGEGSAVLDVASGGNMAEYFQSTYEFMEISPHVLIPMHGKVNLWPKHMLCGYLRNRKNREASVLKALENGAKALYDVVADVYSEVDRSHWFAAASNVRLHIDNLAEQNKLPKGFLVRQYRRSCGVCFVLRWTGSYVGSWLRVKLFGQFSNKVLMAGAVAVCSLLYYLAKR